MAKTAVTKYEAPPEAIQRIEPVLNPLAIVESATVISNELSRIINHAKLYKVISQRKFVFVEGWTSMLAMLGVTPKVVECAKMDREGEIAYRATVELVDRDGRILGSGVSMCSSREKMWSNRDEFAIASMAQTRAVGKSARLSFSWIMTLAGFEATPAEEMDGIEPVQKPHNAPVEEIVVEKPAVKTIQELNDQAIVFERLLGEAENLAMVGTEAELTAWSNKVAGSASGLGKKQLGDLRAAYKQALAQINKRKAA